MSRTLPLLALSLLLASAPVHGEEAVDWEMVTRIREEGFQRSQVMSTLRHLTDAIGPRLTGSPQMRAANEWTRDQLAAWGLKNAQLEEWSPFGRGWSFSRTSVHMLAPLQMPLSALPEAWTPGTEGPVRGTAVRVEIETERDFDKYRGQLAGRIAFMSEAREVDSGDEPAVERNTPEELDELAHYEIPSARQGDFRRGARERLARARAIREFLEAEGVLATVEVSSRDSGLLRVMGGGSREPDEDPGVPGLIMAAEHYNLVLRLIDPPDDAPASTVELELDVTARFHDDASAWNTVAEIPGSDPAAGVVMLGGHLDSWHTGSGATDDGAGCAVAMEAVRILQTLDTRPRRTIRIALWSGEEQGLLGSRAYVKQHFAELPLTGADPDLPERMRPMQGKPHLKPEHAGLAAYFNLDNGSGAIRGVYTQENSGVVPIFRAWLEPFHDLGAETISQRNTGGTDHLAFDAVGLPGFQFIQDRLDYSTRTHHTFVDTFDHARREDLMQASVIMASFVWHAAMRDQPLPRKPLPVYTAPKPAREEATAGGGE